MERTFNMRFNSPNKYLSAQCGIVNYRHDIVRQLSRMCLSFVTETFCPWLALFISSSPQHLATTIPLVDCLSLTVLDTAHKWNHVVFVFLWQISLSITFSRLIRCCHILQNFLLVKCWIISFCMYLQFLIHLSFHEHWGCFHILALRTVLQWTEGPNKSVRSWFQFFE